MRKDYHFWCDQVRSEFPGSDESKLMDLSERELDRFKVIAKRCKRPESKYPANRSFYDLLGGMRQIGEATYDLYTDFTPHIQNRAGAVFLWPTIFEACQRYGRINVPQSVCVRITPPTPRTPQEWKWGPQYTLLTPATKTVKFKGSALKFIQPGLYKIEELKLTVLTSLNDHQFRSYSYSTKGKIEIVSKVASVGVINSTIVVR